MGRYRRAVIQAAADRLREDQQEKSRFKGLVDVMRRALRDFDGLRTIKGATITVRTIEKYSWSYSHMFGIGDSEVEPAIVDGIGGLSVVVERDGTYRACIRGGQGIASQDTGPIMDALVDELAKVVDPDAEPKRPVNREALMKRKPARIAAP
jgi:hypothetical protein